MTVRGSLKSLIRPLIFWAVLLSCVITYASPLPKELHLLTGNDFKPWSDQSLPNGGIITEIVQTTFKKIGIDTTIEWLPWKRGYHRVVADKNGDYATFPYSHSNKRAAEVYYSIPLLISGLTIFVLDKSSVATDYKNQTALHGLRFCTGLGYAFDDFVPLVESGKISLKKFSNIESCFLSIKAGRADAVVINKHVGRGILASLFKEGHDFRTLKEHKPSVYHLVVNKEYPNTLDILHEFNKSLVALQKSGVIEKIISQHMRLDKN